MANNENRRTQNPDDEYVSPTCPPGWAWLLAGVLIGVFLSFLVYLREVAPHNLPIENAQVSESPKSQSASTENFQFYELLPEQQVQIPGTSAGTVDPKQQADLPITTPGRYLLQVGAFRNEQEANGLKGYLTSLGITATIEQSMSKTGQWYRVLVGPFTDLNKLNQTRTLLTKNNIPAILKKF
jgi:cell division protein FtsN